MRCERATVITNVNVTNTSISIKDISRIKSTVDIEFLGAGLPLGSAGEGHNGKLPSLNENNTAIYNL